MPRLPPSSAPASTPCSGWRCSAVSKQTRTPATTASDPSDGVVARPRATAIMCVALAVVITVANLAVWFFLGSDVRARVSAVQAITLLVFLLFSDGLLVMLALSYVCADATGLRFRNFLHTRELRWEEIADIRFREGDPFAYAYLVAQHPSGKDRVQLLGVQQTDGARGRALAAALRAQRPR